MPTSDSARAQVDAAGVSVDTVFDVRGEVLHVRYRLRNTTGAPVAVFDRGDRHAVLTGRQANGAAGVPYLREDGDGRVTLAHVARSLPSPPPTVPPTPLARRLDAGAAIEGEFAFSQWLGDPPAQVRWCLGLAPFDPARMVVPETVDGTGIWQADFAFADEQALACTPWFDVARGQFLADG